MDHKSITNQELFKIINGGGLKKNKINSKTGGNIVNSHRDLITKFK